MGGDIRNNKGGKKTNKTTARECENEDSALGRKKKKMDEIKKNI